MKPAELHRDITERLEQILETLRCNQITPEELWDILEPVQAIEEKLDI